MANLKEKEKEKDIEKSVKAYAVAKGWYVRKFVSPSCNGVPDDIFISPGGHVIFIEFKAPGKRPSHRQESEMAEIIKHYGEVFIIDNIKKDGGWSFWEKDFNNPLVIYHDGFKLIDRLTLRTDRL